VTNFCQVNHGKLVINFTLLLAEALKWDIMPNESFTSLSIESYGNVNLSPSCIETVLWVDFIEMENTHFFYNCRHTIRQNKHQYSLQYQYELFKDIKCILVNTHKETLADDIQLSLKTKS